jgi:hypothetical protein
MNRAYYFLLVIAHFMFEAYKRDVTIEVIPATAYLPAGRQAQTHSGENSLILP